MNNRALLHSIVLALRTMIANKARTALTILGIVIGIASVIIVYSAGEGIYSLVLGQVESFGTDIIQTEVKVPNAKSGDAGQSESANAIVQGVQITSLTLDDMEAVAESKNIKAAYGAMISQEQVSYRSELRRSMVYGVSASFLDIDATKLARGRFFTEAEDRGLTPVVVLGDKIAEKLFGDAEPLGRYVQIRREKFQVIGVMAPRGAFMFVDFDDFIYMPIRSLQKKIMGVDHITMMVHQLRDPDLAEDTAMEAAYIIRTNHDITDEARDDFRVSTMTEQLDTLKTITGAITLLLLAIVVISLIVGGVGIMNIMYVIVSERTSEIGLRKAVGATYDQIMRQFLFEAILITLIGGLVGIVIGVSLSWLLALGARAYGLDWRFIIPIKAYVVALFFSFIFGVVFGVYPARRAAKLDPIEALRSE
jgi:putative ABC transport system permease protein